MTSDDDAVPHRYPGGVEAVRIRVDFHINCYIDIHHGRVSGIIWLCGLFLVIASLNLGLFGGGGGGGGGHDYRPFRVAFWVMHVL